LPHKTQIFWPRRVIPYARIHRDRTWMDVVLDKALIEGVANFAIPTVD
jgi:hypothetical protein